MPSPFPGMNPFLEQTEVWHDFHQTYVTAMRQSLVQQVGARYIVKLELHIYIRELASDERRLLGRADVGINAIRQPPATHTASGVLEAPVHCFVPTGVDVLEESFIEIRKTDTRQLVTTIELLSPANKSPGPDREAYLSKRRQYLVAGNINFVEIDLLRGGPRLPLENLPPCDYYALVARAERRPEVGVWPIQLRDPLPTISVPLLPDDSDARLNLQELLHTTYDEGGYANYIYENEPELRLSAADAEWAQGIFSHLGTLS
jgi:Protein of unknown function (DUF4058)